MVRARRRAEARARFREGAAGERPRDASGAAARGLVVLQETRVSARARRPSGLDLLYPQVSDAFCTFVSRGHPGVLRGTMAVDEGPVILLRV